MWFVVPKHFPLRGRETQANFCVDVLAGQSTSNYAGRIRMVAAHKGKTYQSSLVSPDQVSDGRTGDFEKKLYSIFKALRYGPCALIYFNCQEMNSGEAAHC